MLQLYVAVEPVVTPFTLTAPCTGSVSGGQATSSGSGARESCKCRPQREVMRFKTCLRYAYTLDWTLICVTSERLVYGLFNFPPSTYSLTLCLSAKIGGTAISNVLIA